MKPDYSKLHGVSEIRSIKSAFFPNVRNWVGTSIFGSLKPPNDIFMNKETFEKNLKYYIF